MKKDGQKKCTEPLGSYSLWVVFPPSTSSGIVLWIDGGILEPRLWKEMLSEISCELDAVLGSVPSTLGFYSKVANSHERFSNK